MQLSYDIVDVFTDRAYAGNPLAVVYGAEELPAVQLHAMAREFNLSETTFPAAPTENDRASGIDYRVRIFTPGGEIPFAGHPTLGTAWALRQRGLLQPGRRVQSCPAGLVPVDVAPGSADALELQAAPRDLSGPLTKSAVTALVGSLGLGADDVVGAVHAAGCGISFVHVPVRADAVARARPGGVPLSQLPVRDLGLSDPLDGVNVFAVEEDCQREGPLQVHSRVFVPGLSVPEDPATGSAAVGLGVALAALGIASYEGQTSYRIGQGIEMGRPSVLHGRVETRGGEAVQCWVAGQVVPVATGTLTAPEP